MTARTETEVRFPFDPEVARRVANLQVHVRRAVDGLLSGQHRSPHRGASVVFAEHDEYRPGDDVRRVDWRATARRDRTVIKRFEQESSLRAWVLLDTSGSMSFQGATAPLSKYEFGAVVGATLGHLLVRQGDAVGLVLGASSVEHMLPARATPKQLEALLAQLASVRPADDPTALEPLLAATLERVGRRGLVVLVSDLIDTTPRALEPLRQLVAHGHEVWVVQVLSPDELRFPFEGAVRFKGTEREGTLDLDTDAAKAAYLRSLGAWLDDVHGRVMATGARHVVASTEEGPEVPLGELLAPRRTRGVRRA